VIRLSELARDGMTLRQRGRLRGGAVGLAYDAIRRPYNTGTLSLAATYARWDDLPVALTAVGAEVRFRWLWASPLAFACNPTDCYEGPRPVEGPGLTGAFLNYTPAALPTPAGAPPRTCRTVETAAAAGSACAARRARSARERPRARGAAIVAAIIAVIVASTAGAPAASAGPAPLVAVADLCEHLPHLELCGA
jgi:hypothetical protein